MLTRIGHFASSHPWRYIIAWLVTVAMLVGGVLTIGPAFTSSITAPASESSEGLEIMTTQFPSAGGDSGTIVYKAEQGVSDPEVQSAMTELFEETKQIEGVINVLSPYSPIGASQISSTGDSAGQIAYAQLVLDAGTTTDDGARIGSEIAELAPDIDGLQIELGGDMFRLREPPNSEMLGLAFAIFILIVSFGSVLAMGLPIATALAGVGTGVLTTALLSNIIEMPDFAATIGIMIGLGVGIDYALFIVTRYQEHPRHAADGHHVRDRAGDCGSNHGLADHGCISDVAACIDRPRRHAHSDNSVERTDRFTARSDCPHRCRPRHPCSTLRCTTRCHRCHRRSLQGTTQPDGQPWL
jgi:RND superfamily putative drug exporter